MAVSIGSIVLHVSDIGRAARFWCAALGYVPQPDEPAFLAPADSVGPRLHLDETDRTHLDLWVDRTGSDQDSEVERLVSLGTRPVEMVSPAVAGLVLPPADRARRFSFAAPLTCT